MSGDHGSAAAFLPGRALLGLSTHGNRRGPPLFASRSADRAAPAAAACSDMVSSVIFTQEDESAVVRAKPHARRWVRASWVDGPDLEPGRRFDGNSDAAARFRRAEQYIALPK